MKMTWGELGRRFGLKGPEDTVEIAADAAGPESVTTPEAPAVARQPDPESERLRQQLADARNREEARLRRDGESFAALAVRDEKAPPYLAAVLAAEYEAVALMDLDRPLAQAIRVGEAECATRVEALREHYAQLRPAGHTTQRALDRARTVPNGSEGEPDAATRAYNQGAAYAEARNGRK